MGETGALTFMDIWVPVHSEGEATNLAVIKNFPAVIHLHSDSPPAGPSSSVSTEASTEAAASAPVQGQADLSPKTRRQIGMFAALEAQHAFKGTTCFRAHAPKERARTVPVLQSHAHRIIKEKKKKNENSKSCKIVCGEKKIEKHWEETRSPRLYGDPRRQQTC